MTVYIWLFIEMNDTMAIRSIGMFKYITAINVAEIEK